MGSDVTYGAPLTIADADTDRLIVLAGFGQSWAARSRTAWRHGFQTYCRRSWWNRAGLFCKSCDQSRTDTAAAQTAHPAAGYAGDVAAAVPYALQPEGIAGRHRYRRGSRRGGLAGLEQLSGTAGHAKGCSVDRRRDWSRALARSAGEHPFQFRQTGKPWSMLCKVPA